MSTKNQNIDELLTLANNYPSPHNGQPIRIKQTGQDTFDIFFDKQRGLQSSEISFIFSFVSIGVFVDHMKACAQALGHKFTSRLSLPSEQSLRGSGTIKIADCKLEWSVAEPDTELKKVIEQRQTSRKKYYHDVDGQTASKLIRVAADNGMRLNHLTKGQSQEATWLNQRAVFDDMFDKAVRDELDHWLRYTSEQKLSKRDGLAYDCMELNGKLMKRIVDHPKVLRMPGVSWLIKNYYSRTMRDSSSVFYMMAPFANEKQAYEVGETIIKLWLLITKAGYYLHPFGTIMSNEAAHKDFLQLAGENTETRSEYLVFIFRCGKSESPVSSLRMPIQQHLIME